MTPGAGTTGPSEAARLSERVLRRLVEHPYGYPFAALVVALVISGVRQHESTDALLEIGVMSLLFAGWLPLWVRVGQPTGPWGAPNIGLALIGSVIQGRMVALDLGFAIVALAVMPQSFLRLPFWIAVLCGVGPVAGSEYAHRLMILAHPEGFPFGPAILRFVAVMAIGVSLKLMAIQSEERARLQASLATAERKAGVLEERQRLAREIHDTLAQGFAGIVVHLETAEQIDPLRGSPVKPHLDLARSVAREGLEEARRMLQALRPEILAQRGLPEALDRVCDDWSRRSGLRANLEVTGSAAPMHPDIELTILRAVQEGLTNIGKHAEARTATVTLSYMEDMIVLDVQDDGRGFVPSAGPGGGSGTGFGLAGMRERTEALQGSFSVESVPGEGTTISISLPVLGTTGTYPAGGGSA
jgi:signal transduction histidine kinase